MRVQVAQVAARLMHEHGITDYEHARRKAAEQFGVADRAMLPEPREIRAALAEYQRLFGGVLHLDHQASLRAAALAAMRFLKPFEPRLVGDVLAGTAGPGTPVTLHLFCDSPEQVLIYLLDRNVAVAQRERTVMLDETRRQRVPAFEFGADDVDIEVLVFPWDGLRAAPRAPEEGGSVIRASIPEVEALLQQTP